MEHNTNKEHESRLTLVSFLALLVRYRKLILITVAVVAFLITFVYWLLPTIGVVVYARPPQYHSQVNLTLPDYPPEARRAIDFDVPVWVAREFRDTRRVLEAYDATLGLPAGLDATGADTWISSNVLPSLSARWDVRTRVLTVSYVNDHPDGVAAFVSALERNVRQATEQRTNDLLKLHQTNLAAAGDSLVRSLAETLQQNISGLTGALDAALAAETSTALDYLRLAAQEVAIDLALASDALPWRAGTRVTIVERPDTSLLADRSRGAALLFLIGIVFAVLLAVVADYVQYVRSELGSV